MHGRRSTWLTACACVALALSGESGAQTPDGVDDLLKHADDIKTSNNSEFMQIVQGLDRESSRFSGVQHAWLDYLKAWQLGYTGDFEAAVPALKAVISETADPTLRVRAQISLINDQAFTSHYDEAYAGLSDLLEMQPHVADKNARMLVFAVAALLYNEAGQYDLALNYAERWRAEDDAGTAQCRAVYLMLDAQFRSGKLSLDDPRIQGTIDGCTTVGDVLSANIVRTFVANIEIAKGRVKDAIKLIRANDADVQRTHSARISSEFHSILARAYLLTGDVALAKQYALSAVQKSIKKESSKPLVDALGVLYKVAQLEGEYKSALEYHERYAAADKGYLGDTGARALAYEMVKQQVLDKKLQIEALKGSNRVLQLEKEVAAKSEETERLYVLLLASVLGFIVLWGYRTKRSQLRFQKLSRRDGLTGILNRQHFMDEAKAILEECRNSGREICLILIDLDNFKAVNDSHGHVAGDGVLQCTTAVLQVNMRAMDIFGRVGGEEFGVLLPDCVLENARQRAEDLRLTIGRMDRAETSIDFDVSASFGVASGREAGYDLRQMLIHADSALYLAKRNGRNRVEAFTLSVAEEVAAAIAHPQTASQGTLH
ncbi:MAG TPA: GGDEF domain-containing protein [Rudaea sp.]|nr:GGDEF domain-containing protein [Rudaea sp.]